MSEIEIRVVSTADDILSIWPLLKLVPVFNSTYEEVLANCLTGKFTLVLGFKDKKFECFAIVQLYQPEHLFIIAVYAENKIRDFMEPFQDWCRLHSIKKLSSVSNAPEKVYSRLMKMQKVYSVFTKEI